MNNNYNDIKVAVTGGDMRMIYCASALADAGFEVGFSGFDNAAIERTGAVRCRSAEDAGDRTPKAPRASRDPLKPIINR